MSGTLYIVATPIGNLEDITLRAVRILSGVAGIAAEDTRRTRKLLNHLDIHKPLLSLHEYNESMRSDYLAEKLGGGEDWAFVSDAGTPGLSDPGAELVATLRSRGFPVVPIPGPSALAAAISVSGLQDSRFYFEGFLPAGGTQRKNRLESLRSLEVPLFLYEAPHRLYKTLQALFDTLGDRELLLFRELTKLHEEVLDTTLSDALSHQTPARGEYVLLVKPGARVEIVVTDEAIVSHAHVLMGGGMTRKQAVAQTASDLCVRKNRVYRLMIDS